MLRRPRPLRAGDSIAVLAPASAPRDPAPYEEGLARLRTTYDLHMVWEPGTERGYLSAPDPDRVDALNRAIRAPDIRAVLCVRGGYGCLRLLSFVDWTLARENPTLLVGYSDVTALHLAFYTHAGWTGISGPVVTEWAQADETTLESFKALSTGESKQFLTGFDASMTSIVEGTATGPLLGGNLAVLTRLIGTPHAPDFEGVILVLEEVSEAPYRIDRMLAHLQLAGVLDAVAGVVLGHFTTGDLDPDTPTLSLSTVFHHYFASRSYPVISGFPYGHLLPRCSLPLGVPVRLHAAPEACSLEMDTSVVKT